MVLPELEDVRLGSEISHVPPNKGFQDNAPQAART
jgi:hypothetical protein